MSESTQPWWDHAINDFVQTLGMSAAQEASKGVVHLALEQGRFRVEIEGTSDDIVVALVHHVEKANLEEVSRALLGACGDRNAAFFTQVALDGEDTMVLATRIAAPEAHTLGDGLAHLRALYAEAGR